MSFIITLIFLIWVIQLVRRAQTKGKQEAAERRRTGYGSAASRTSRTDGNDPGRVTPTIPRPGMQRKNPAAGPSRSAAPRKGQTVRQQLVDANGITFRDLRPGTDELEYLIQYNRARESQLEQALESRQG